MTGHQRHFGQIGHIPGAHDDAARIGVGFELLHGLRDLVNMTARIFRGGRRPAAPLHAIHRPEITRFLVGPFIPNRYAAFLQPGGIAVAAQKPQQFENDGFQVHLFGGDQRKAFGKIEAHLVAKHAARARAGAVSFGHAVLEHMAHEGFVLVGGHERYYGESFPAFLLYARSASQGQTPFPRQRAGAVARRHLGGATQKPASGWQGQ